MPEEKVSQYAEAMGRALDEAMGGDRLHPKPAPDAGPRPRTRHEFNQGPGFCEICGGHNTHVRSEYCLPPPKRPAVPQEARELTKAEWKEIAEGPCEAEDDDLSLDAKATAPDSAMRVAREIVPSVHENYAFDDTLPEREAVYAHVAALIREAGSERERGLLLLAGRLCESQSPEWGDVDGATIEEWLLEAGLFKQIDVSEPCDPENCVCAEFGFPTKCNRRTELGKRAIRLAGGE